MHFDQFGVFRLVSRIEPSRQFSYPWHGACLDWWILFMLIVMSLQTHFSIIT